MDKELASLIVNAAYRSSSELQELIPVVRDHCSAEEADDFLRRVATVLAEINFSILRPVFKQVPGLEAEFDARIEKYGHAS